MLHIKCSSCGQILKAKEVKITPFTVNLCGVKYKDYALSCSRCGGIVLWDRYTKKAAENKAKAMAKIASKTGESPAEIDETEQYDTIMRNVAKRAKEIAVSKKGNPKVTVLDFEAALSELPSQEKSIVLSYEDKQDMTLLKVGSSKPVRYAGYNPVLLLTQGIIEGAIKEKDEDFFQSDYGEQICDTYNAALTARTKHDYGITAALLLEKMRKGRIRVRGENDDE